MVTASETSVSLAAPSASGRHGEMPLSGTAGVRVRDKVRSHQVLGASLLVVEVATRSLLPLMGALRIIPPLDKVVGAGVIRVEGVRA